MSLWVLDTDHVTLLQHDHPHVSRRFAAVASSDVAVAVISAEEQIRGRLNIIRKYGTTARQVQAYIAFRTTLDFFNRITLLDFDQAAYTHYEPLRQQKIRIGSQDLRIAAIVLATNGILVTRNARDFGQVPGLTITDWSLP